MSFPMPGYTLALDFPATPDVLALLADFDRAVVEGGGRVFLAKDAISTPERVAKSYSGLAAFRAVRRRVDPSGKFASLLSRRLDL
jgi:FAD/FMN-containing dehydrogenase